MFHFIGDVGVGLQALEDFLQQRLDLTARLAGGCLDFLGVVEVKEVVSGSARYVKSLSATIELIALAV